MGWFPSWLSKPEQLTPIKPVEVKPPPVNKPGPIEVLPPGEMQYLDKNKKLLINRKVIELTKHFEGLVLVAEDDGYGTPTVGYGRIKYDDGRKVRNGDRCTEAQAESWLLHDLFEEGAKYVRALLKDDVENALTDDEFGVWVDLCFNRGVGRFREGVAPFLNRGDKAGALKAMCGSLYTTAGGRYSLGLDRRRWAERFILEGKNWRHLDTKEKFLAFQKTDEYKRGRA